MDADRFDVFARSLIVARSRRDMVRLLSGILGGSLPLLAQGEAEARCRRRPCIEGGCAGCCDAKNCCRPGTKDSACGLPVSKAPTPCASCSGATPRCFQGVCSQCREDLDCSLDEFCDAGSCTPCRGLGGGCNRSRQCCSACCDTRVGEPTQFICLADRPVGGECRDDDDCCPGLRCAIPRGETSGTCKKPR